MVITISGSPGSGKTTVARLVAAQLGLEHVYAGDIFRRQAEAAGLSLQEYAQQAERDHGIDQRLDAQMRERARTGQVVLEGRLAHVMADQAGVAALRVYLDANESLRAVRVAGREGGEAAVRLQELQRREASDGRRYREIYGVDYHDQSAYDVVLDTTELSPEEVASRIVTRARAGA